MAQLVLSRRATAALLGALMLALATLGPRDAAAANAAVGIDSFAFGPTPVTVNVGESVTWTNNQQGIPHTASSTGGVFDSGTLNTGGSFSFTFTTAGTFAYRCNIHTTMTGSVTVAGASQAPTATVPAPTATVPAPAATATVPAATAVPTATTAAANPTAVATQPSTSSSPTSVAATPGAPAAGDEDDDGGSNVMMIVLILGAAAVVAAAGGYAVLRRRT